MPFSRLFFKMVDNLTLDTATSTRCKTQSRRLAIPENVFSDNPARDLQTVGPYAGWGV